MRAVPVDEGVLKWLLGEQEHPDTGEWFERPGGRAGNFWWRTELRAAMEAAAALQSRDEPAAWIPVSERLPEKNGDYWTTVAPMFGSPFVVMQRYSRQNHIFISGWEKSKVTHWMSPTPPRKP